MSDEDDNDTNPGIELPREKTTISTAPAAPVRATPLPPQRQRGVPSSAAAAAFPAPAMRAGFAVRPSAAPPPMAKPAAPPPLPKAPPAGMPSPSISPTMPTATSSLGTSPSAAPPSARPPSTPPPPAPPVDYLEAFEPTPSRLNELPELPPAMTLVGHRAPEPKAPEPPPAASAPAPAPAAAAAPAAAPAAASPAPSRGTIPPAASASPSLLIPKPSLGAAAGGGAGVTQIEVQLQSVRAQLSRAEAEVQTAVRRAEAAEQRASSYAGRIEALEAALAAVQASLSSRIDAVAERADKPVATRPLEERIEKVERMRAELTAAQHELAEHGRLFESRKARVDSLETRIGRLESDQRFTEIRRPIESLDLRMSAIEAGRDAPLVAVRGELEALVRRVAELQARAEAAPSAKRRTTGSHEKLEGSLEGIKGLGPKTKKQLNDLGVTDAAQIAAWTEADLSRFSEELGTAKKKLEAWVQAAKAAR